MPRKRYSFWIDDRQAEGLKRIKERDGVLESESIRRAIDRWLEARGVVKSGKRSVSPLRKP
jgi:hypothetical protein